MGTLNEFYDCLLKQDCLWVNTVHLTLDDFFKQS